MAKVISQFFADLGYPFRNIRWSWGARSGDAILLRTWDDEYAFKEKKLGVLDMVDADERTDSFGLDERIVQLKALWDGGVAGYTVIATAKDKNARPREIVAYRDDGVFALSRLERESNGDIVAIVGELVPIFRQVQTRPDQGLFRDAVFQACGGQCVVSGCAVPEALEAAHLFGRDWREGHNTETDGILLRRDLHNLYDCGLLRINDAGQVALSGDTCDYYGEFHGKSVTTRLG